MRIAFQSVPKLPEFREAGEKGTRDPIKVSIKLGLERYQYE
jgi:hypothetical protein